MKIDPSSGLVSVFGRREEKKPVRTGNGSSTETHEQRRRYYTNGRRTNNLGALSPRALNY